MFFMAVSSSSDAPTAFFFSKKSETSEDTAVPSLYKQNDVISRCRKNAL